MWSIRNLFYVNYFTKCLKPYSQAKIQENIIDNLPDYFSLSPNFPKIDRNLAESLVASMKVHYEFISGAEENSILDEIQPYMKRLRYEFDHWDNAIHGYRETERLQWKNENTKILNKVRSIAFPPTVSQLKLVHILDLDHKGYIKPHVDSVRFCGDTIAGISLLTDSVMRLVNEKNKLLYGDVLLKRRSLYIMTGVARYDFTHEVLKNEESFFKGQKVEKARRISVMCRNEPDPNSKNTI